MEDEAKDLERRFEVVAFGCNHWARSDLRKLFRSKGLLTFQLIEYFLRDPITKQEPAANGGILFFPFLRRLAEEMPFVPQGGSLREPRVFAKTASAVRRLEEMDYQLPLARALVGKRIISAWRSSLDFPAGKGTTLPVCDQYGPREWSELESYVRATPEPYRAAHMLEYDLAARPWSWCSDECPAVVAGYPIASRNVLYGYFLLIWPAGDWSEEFLTREVYQCLRGLDKDVYRPTLALLHNSIWEARIRKVAERKGATGTAVRSAIEALPVWRWQPNESEDCVERSLRILWQRRHHLLAEDRVGRNADALQRVVGTLLFDRYNVASPGLIEQVRRVMEAGPRLRAPRTAGRPLPSALIYGEPGSGKDTMAQMVRIFTDLVDGTDSDGGGFFDSQVVVVNMAALKPNAIVGPLLMGARLSEFPKGEIAGLFTTDEQPLGDRETENIGSSPRQSVFVLDELNSLDIDLQGILLRILENGEVTPLFTRRQQSVRHLIIGVVNEDPQTLIKEQEIRGLGQLESFFGRMLGGVLYELLSRGRRLRPDLFYRLKRDLYVCVPPLRHRREDIPILFFFNCESEVQAEWRSRYGDTKRRPRVSVEFAAYDLLMRPDLEWLGNVRQLQAVAKAAATSALERPAERLVVVNAEDVDMALREGIDEPPGRR